MDAAKTLRIASVALAAFAVSGTTAASAAAKSHPRHPVHHKKHHKKHRRLRAVAHFAVAPHPRIPTVRIAITGATYYVSPSGSDSNSGTSPNQAWRTVDRVNSANLHPGDGVLFQGGATFSDDTLMPPTSGASGQPIVFGSYGQGRGLLSKGVWFVQNHLAFTNLAVGATFYGGSEVKGTSNDIAIVGCSISLPNNNSSLGMYTNGNHWTIQNNRVNNTGLSGMLLNGDQYLVSGNTISNTGRDTSVNYNAHGIYLDASDATISGNTITNFAESAVSVRYRNSSLTYNRISNGRIGVDFFQTDPHTGASHWTGNTLTGTTVAGIFISSSGAAGDTAETFDISHNVLHRAAGVFMNLKPTRGAYHVGSNGLS